MAKFNRWMMAAGMAALIGTTTLASAQDNNGGQGGPGGGRNGGGPRNWDPAQMQQRILDGTKERLEITDEAEWKALLPLVQKVMDAQRSL